MDFVYLLRILMKRKWIIIGSAIVAAAVAYILTLNQPKKYRSTAQVATGYTTYDPMKLVNENADYYQQDTKFNNVIVTFTSPPVINLLSYNLILHDLTQPDPFHKLTEEEKTLAFKNISKDSAIKAFREKVRTMSILSPSVAEDKKLMNLLDQYQYDYTTLTKNLNVSRFQRTDYLNIDYVSTDPNLSAFVVNTAYDEFIRYYGTSRGKTAAESIDTLRSIMEKKKQILDQKNELLQRTGYGTSEIQSTGDLDIIANLESELTNERSKLTTFQANLRKVNQRLADLSRAPSETSSSDNDEVIQLRTAMNNAYNDYLRTNDQADYKKYNALKAKYQQKVLSSRSGSVTAKDPVSEKIDLQSQKTDLEIDIQSSSSFISSLQSKINSLKGSVTSAASSTAAGESLKKDVDFANKEYLEAQQRYNAATDIGGASLVNFRVIVPGQPAISPEPSKRPLIIALAAFAALLTTIGIIIFLTYLDTSIRTPTIFSKNVNLKMISLVNFMNLKNKSITDVISNKLIATDEAEHKRNNIFRESIRKLRYEIETSGKKIFLFTSTKKGQGKTTLIQALAYSMSLSKKKVLIIDTNFCNNDLTVQLNAEPVLEKIVPYKSDNKALIEQVKVFSKDLGLGTVYAIGSEGGDYTPSEILPRENLLQHLQLLTSDFDYIFLEGPPLNDFSDSKELAQYVDGVIAVFSAHEVIKQIDKQSISFFKELNGKFTGSILNMVDLKNINVV
ncbi:MAG TPA: Wzz/FepE/Etk N-terminal domain-containing protein [Flavisolibacter sp.]|nr:Wzz/FepE/Etk N-terminal domain-containing protein [Flavisolibacter sp.]